MITKEDAQNELLKSLRQLILAHAELSTIEEGQTLYERHPSRSDRALAAWQELNNAIRNGKVVLRRAMVILGPDDELTAGPEITP